MPVCPLPDFYQTGKCPLPVARLFVPVGNTRWQAHFSVVVPKNVRVAQGPGLDDAGEIDGTSSLDEQFLVAQDCRVRLCKEMGKESH